MSFDYNKFVSGKQLLQEYGNLVSPDLSDPRKTEPNPTAQVSHMNEEGGMPKEAILDELYTLSVWEIGEILNDLRMMIEQDSELPTQYLDKILPALDNAANAMISVPEDWDTREDGPDQDQQLQEKSHDFGKLSEDEKTQLKEYINSVKEIKKEIRGLMEKAKMEERGGDMTGRMLNVEDKKKLKKEALTPPAPNAIYKKDSIKNKLIQWLQDQGNNVRYTDMINAVYALGKGVEPGSVKAPRGYYSTNFFSQDDGGRWGNQGKKYMAKKGPGTGRIVKNPDGTWGGEW